MPVATDYGFIINSDNEDEIFDFYIFESDEITNLQKCLLAFYNYGAYFSDEVLNELKKVKANDFHVNFHLNKLGLLSLKLMLKELN